MIQKLKSQCRKYQRDPQLQHRQIFDLLTFFRPSKLFRFWRLNFLEIVFLNLLQKRSLIFDDPRKFRIMHTQLTRGTRR
jgi:hypothetical protein